jgi:inosine-uridine nucleoside N-ribohydrolase
VKVNKEGEKASVVHDAIAVAYVIDPSKCETEEDRIEIQADRFMEGTWGQSKVVDGTPNCTVITDIDMDFYRDLYRRTVEHFGDLA